MIFWITGSSRNRIESEKFITFGGQSQVGLVQWPAPGHHRLWSSFVGQRSSCPTGTRATCNLPTSGKTDCETVSLIGTSAFHGSPTELLPREGFLERAPLAEQFGRSQHSDHLATRAAGHEGYGATCSRTRRASSLRPHLRIERVFACTRDEEG